MTLNAKTLSELRNDIDRIIDQVGGTTLCNVTALNITKGFRTIEVETLGSEDVATIEYLERQIRDLESENDDLQDRVVSQRREIGNLLDEGTT